MKVVLFCGGRGMRLREYSDAIPKPMVPIGYRPMLWHIMRYYAHFGHKDFILCLGYKADLIKKYFIDYDEYISNDFIMEGRDKSIEMLRTDMDDWRITFVDTGLQSNVGERLMAVRHFLKGEETFLANYSDGLTDLNLPDMIEYFEKENRIGCFMAYRPRQSFHLVELQNNGCVRDISHIGDVGLWMNAGYFIFKQEIFEHMEESEELVIKPFRRLIEQDELRAFRHAGFWASLDTFKDKQLLDDLYDQGGVPWEVWSPAGARDGKQQWSLLD